MMAMSKRTLLGTALIVLLGLGAALAEPVRAADSATAVTCGDGTSSSSTGKGACSHHGGVKTATAKCKDGSLSYAKQHSGACSKQGGVAEFLDQGGSSSGSTK